MTVNEAYTKGLDDAETQVFELISAALNGEDKGKFNNPKMELLKSMVLSRQAPKPEVIIREVVADTSVLEQTFIDLLKGKRKLPELEGSQAALRDAYALVIREVRDVSKKPTKQGTVFEGLLNEALNKLN